MCEYEVVPAFNAIRFTALWLIESIEHYLWKDLSLSSSNNKKAIQTEVKDHQPLTTELEVLTQ